MSNKISYKRYYTSFTSGIKGEVAMKQLLAKDYTDQTPAIVVLDYILWSLLVPLTEQFNYFWFRISDLSFDNRQKGGGGGGERGINFPA